MLNHGGELGAEAIRWSNRTLAAPRRTRFDTVWIALLAAEAHRVAPTAILLTRRTVYQELSVWIQ